MGQQLLTDRMPLRGPGDGRSERSLWTEVPSLPGRPALRRHVPRKRMRPDVRRVCRLAHGGGSRHRARRGAVSDVHRGSGPRRIPRTACLAQPAHDRDRDPPGRVDQLVHHPKPAERRIRCVYQELMVRAVGLALDVRPHRRSRGLLRLWRPFCAGEPALARKKRPVGPGAGDPHEARGRRLRPGRNGARPASP